MGLFTSKNLDSLETLFVDQIEDLYDAEQRLTQALPPGLSTTAISADRLLRHRPLAPLGCRLLRRLQPQHALTAPAP